MVCPICDEDKPLTKHHLYPKAAKPWPPHWPRTRGCDKQNIYLCDSCHKLAHRHGGPGNNWHGPVLLLDFILWLRSKIT